MKKHKLVGKAFRWHQFINENRHLYCMYYMSPTFGIICRRQGKKFKRYLKIKYAEWWNIKKL